MCEWANGGETILPLPAWIPKDNDNRTVCVDSCIADVIKRLWEKGVVTLGCCCGHGKSNPCVILDTHMDSDYAANLLQAIDPRRTWDVMQWRLVIVKSSKEGI